MQSPTGLYDAVTLLKVDLITIHVFIYR